MGAWWGNKVLPLGMILVRPRMRVIDYTLLLRGSKMYTYIPTPEELEARRGGRLVQSQSAPRSEGTFQSKYGTQRPRLERVTGLVYREDRPGKSALPRFRPRFRGPDGEEHPLACGALRQPCSASPCIAISASAPRPIRHGRVAVVPRQVVPRQDEERPQPLFRPVLAVEHMWPHAHECLAPLCEAHA